LQRRRQPGAARFERIPSAIDSWWTWLRECTQDFAFLLRSRFPELGRTGDTTTFWRTCFRLMSLDKAMAWLDRDGLSVP
jgi:hypothetical protein